MTRRCFAGARLAVIVVVAGATGAAAEPPVLRPADRPADLAPPATLRSPQLAIRSITGHDDIYHRHMGYAALIPGGRLLTGRGDGALRLWRLDGARLLREQAPRPDEKGLSTRGWVVSPDGKLLAIHMHPGTLDVFEVETGRLVQRQTGMWDLRQIAFSAPRTLMLLETDPRTRYRQLRAIDAVDGKTIATAMVLGAVAFAPAPDGSRVAVVGPTWLKVIAGSLAGDPLWDAAMPICIDDDSTRIEQRLWFGNHRCSPRLLWNGDGSRLVEVAGTMIAIFDGASGRRLWELGRGDLHRPILRASLSVDGKLAIAGEGFTFLLPSSDRLPPGGANLFAQRKNVPEADGETFSPDGRLLFSWRRGRLRAIDAETAEPVVADGGHAGPVRRLAAAPDGKRLLSAADDRSVRLWDGTRELRRWRLASDTLAFTPEGDRFVTTRATASWPGDAVFIDSATGADLLTIPRVHHVALSPDGSALASLGVTDGLCLFDSRTGARRWCQKPKAINTVGVLAFLPGRAGVVAADKKYQLRVWDFASGKPIRSFGESFTNVFLPIGDKPTSAVVVARGTTGGVLQSLVPGAALPPWQPAFPAPVAVSPDGKYLLAHWRDLSYGIIYVVRLRDGVVIDSLDPCLADEIFTSSAWSSDGARIHAGSVRGRLYEIAFDRAAAETAAAYEPANKEELGMCHARWH